MKDAYAGAWFLFALAVYAVGFVGWVMNIVTIVSVLNMMPGERDILMLIFRVVGVFVAPLGAVLGFI